MQQYWKDKIKSLDPVLPRLSLKNNPFLVVAFVSEPWTRALFRRSLYFWSLRPDFSCF